MAGCRSCLRPNNKCLEMSLGASVLTCVLVHDKPVHDELVQDELVHDGLVCELVYEISAINHKTKAIYQNKVMARV